MPATDKELDVACRRAISNWDDWHVDLNTLSQLDLSYAAKKVLDDIRYELWGMDRYWPRWEDRHRI